MNSGANQLSSRELAAALSALKRASFGIGAISGVINILTLTGSFFMLQVYDRVLPSRSLPTLAVLCLVAALLFLFQGLLEFIRSRVLVQIGVALDQRLSPSIYGALLRNPLVAKTGGDGLQPLRDLDQVRSFVSGPGPTALFDLPWVPLYLAICFAFHVWIGVTALAGAILLVALMLLAEAYTKEPTRQAASAAAERNALAEASRRNAEALHAMGFAERISDRWAVLNDRYMRAQADASGVAGSLGTISKVVRLALQSGILAVGAILVVIGQATGGIMIAGSIVMSRALAPIELAIAHWKGFIVARQSWKRLRTLLTQMPAVPDRVSLPPPDGTLSVESVTATPPGERNIVVADVSFKLDRGAGLGIIGPSASGKSSLVRLLVGAWVPVRGSIRLDGAALDQWLPSELGKHIGYLPQEVSLFDGSVAENISRFDPQAPPEMILAAAKAAGVHEMIVRLSAGYDTRVGEAGSALSAGQRQRIGLARALYGNPFFVVLDEPNSNLDAQGDAALSRAIAGVRQRGGIVIVVAHRPSVLANIDQVLVMAHGRIQAMGPKDEVLRSATKPVTPALKVIGTPEGVTSQ